MSSTSNAPSTKKTSVQTDSPADTAVDAMDSQSTTSDDQEQAGTISHWIEIKNQVMSAPSDRLQMSRMLSLGEWDIDRPPCFSLSLKVRPANAPKWFYASLNLNKKEATWIRENAGLIHARGTHHYDIKSKDGAVLRSLTKEVETRKGVDRLVLRQMKNGREFKPFRIPRNKIGDLINAVTDSLDEFQDFIDKRYEELEELESA